MRLVLISDTHGRHRELQLPEGDVLIHAGDFSSAGSWDELLEFSDWFQAQPHRHKILIAGNHDLLFEDFPEDARALFKGWAHYLQDSALTLEGLKIHGSPWTPRFFDYAFMLPRGRALAERWAKIPADTQLLITHGPAQGLGDRTFTGENAGCEALAEQLPRLPDLQLHVFGHIHEGYGYYPPSARRRYASVNVSNCRWGDPGLNEPIWLDVPVNL
ncbi:metallophosphatase domain-containing protein [Marinospirillum sp.]|uniref:metallophosphatase domain-containing protein n=1 Tax=Marinospirillum sp. TaxID=2183934 RepID=UPI00287055C2|nr:metallophosphatase domain-containing protein [Marinospirillum sp.]MDR9466881.1 metallophosphatase domain-containing protein [Marinospirillum sp.]